ncbi:MAG TPA: ATP-binding protein [Burkholderiaceae bacterium]|nr:ATP-binding protein [Burkholderiaceae bacterium]
MIPPVRSSESPTDVRGEPASAPAVPCAPVGPSVPCDVPAATELAALYAHAPLGFAVLDPAMRFVRINAWLAAINGLPVERHVGRTVPELLPGIADQIRTAMERVLATGRPLVDFELVGDTPAAPGIPRTFREQWFPILGPGGETIAVGVVVEETTQLRTLALENRRVTGQLEARQARDEFLLGLHDQMRLCTDPAELAHRACRLLGERLGGVRVGFAELDDGGRTLVVRPPRADGSPRPDARHPASSLGEALLRDLHAGRSRAVRALSADAAPAVFADAALGAGPTRAMVAVPVFEDGRLRGLLLASASTHRDWSRDEIELVEAVAARTFEAVLRARADAQLKASEERLRLAQRAARIAIYDYDLVAGTRTWDDRIRELWGLPPDVPLGREFLMSFVPPEDAAAMDAAIERALDPRGDRAVNVEYRVRRASDGEEIRVHATGLVTFDGDRPVRLTGTLKDITELRRVEFALREADRRKDEFLAMLAHELRNPLAPLRNSLRILERTELPPACGPTLEIATRQVRHMSRLVDDLLEVSRITRGLIRVKPERLLLQQAVFAVAESLAGSIEQRRQRLEFDLPRSPLWVEADPTRFAQIVENLLTNASKYSEADTVVTVRAVARDAEVLIEVQDQGIGLDAENLEKVFELFTQVDATLDRAHGGLGIGLALVRRLAEAHGGRATASSEGRGRGATFSVALPAARP